MPKGSGVLEKLTYSHNNELLAQFKLPAKYSTIEGLGQLPMAIRILSGIMVFTLIFSPMLGNLWIILDANGKAITATTVPIGYQNDKERAKEIESEGGVYLVEYKSAYEGGWNYPQIYKFYLHSSG